MAKLTIPQTRLLRSRINWLSGLVDYEVDWSHPVARNLVRCFLPGVSAKDYASTTGAIIYNGGTNGARTVGMKGSEYNSSGVNAGTGFLIDRSVLQFSPSNISIMALCKVPSGAVSSGSGAALYCERQAAGGTIIKLNYDSRVSPQGTCFTFTLRNDSANLIDLRGTLSQNDGIWHSWCGIKNGNTGANNVVLYKDGVVNTSGTWNNPDTFNNTLVTTLGYDNADLSGNFLGSIACIYAWTRNLSQDEVVYMTRDPFALIRPTTASTLDFFDASIAPADFSTFRLLGLADAEY